MNRIFLRLVALLVVVNCSSGNFSYLPVIRAQEISSETGEEFEEDEEEWLDEEGFEESGEDAFQEIEVETPAETRVDASTGFSGFFKEELNYSYQKPDADLPFMRSGAEWTKIRSTLNLSYQFPLSEKWRVKVSGNAFYDAYYSQKNRSDFSGETLNAFEAEAELRDTFIEGPITGSLWIKVGRQIMAWGESEVTAITDVGNPRDNRELGLVDVEDARIPVWASKFSYSNGSWEWNLVAIHEFRPNKRATPGADFDPYIGIPFTVAPEARPESTGKETEWLVRFFKSFNGGDVGFVAADVFADDPYLDFQSQNSTFIPRYKRTRTFGASGNYVSGPWLFKFELARKLGVILGRREEDIRRQLKNEVPHPQSWSEKDLTQFMLGFDYLGVSDLTTTVEVNMTRIEAYEPNLFNEEHRATLALALRYDTWSNRLHPRFVWVRLPHDNGDLFRLSADYDIMDALQFSGGVIIYQADRKDDLLYAFRNNDRILVSMKYSF